MRSGGGCAPGSGACDRGRIRTPFWSVTKHEDALTVFRNPAVFSSQRVYRSPGGYVLQSA